MPQPVSAASATGEVDPEPSQRAYTVFVPEAARLPTQCAGCDGQAAAAQALRRGTRSLLVPYCSACQQRLDATRTRDIALTLGSLLLGTTAAATLLLIWDRMGAIVYGALTLGMAALPLLLASRLPRETACVWWHGPERLGCHNQAWAKRFAELNGAEVHSEPHVPKQRLPALAYSGLVLTAIAASWLFELHRPRLLILNVSGRPLSVQMDGEALASVPSTAAESASAGSLQRPAAGRHTVTVRSDAGEVLLEEFLTLAGDTDHLFAPLSNQYCFWLETVSYGRRGGPKRTRQPLSGSRRFWPLPDPVDIWFAAPPNEAPSDQRSSGGRLTALRQALCTEAPAEVRRARP